MVRALLVRLGGRGRGVAAVATKVTMGVGYRDGGGGVKPLPHYGLRDGRGDDGLIALQRSKAKPFIGLAFNLEHVITQTLEPVCEQLVATRPTVAWQTAGL